PARTARTSGGTVGRGVGAGAVVTRATGVGVATGFAGPARRTPPKIAPPTHPAPIRPPPPPPPRPDHRQAPPPPRAARQPPPHRFPVHQPHERHEEERQDF